MPVILNFRSEASFTSARIPTLANNLRTTFCAVRKTPLMRVKDGANYILVGSVGGAPNNPVWVYNLRARPTVEIRDHTETQAMRVREVSDDAERGRLWKLAVAAYPPYEEYQAKTTRQIPIFVAEPMR